ncbi:CYTH domain-containing protein [Zymobacter palmae]|nr:CYTH domain-containing protein [Zymobacter palmae]
MPSPIELELKLALDADAVAILPTLSPLSKSAVERLDMRNQYFDTPSRDLEAARMALRIRRFGDTIVQTVKTAGQGSGGLHRRGEWEWTLDSDQLDTHALVRLAQQEAQHYPELACLASLEVVEQLAPVYTTDFVRQAWQLTLDDGSHIEAALDQGMIHSGHHTLPIRELELELKHGDTEALWSLARTLSQHIALRPANASKAQRAVALSEGYHAPHHTASNDTVLFDRAIDALDAATDGFMPEGYATAATLLAELSARLPQPLNATTHALADTLRRRGADALDQAFGQHCLRLMQHFTAA